MRKYFLLAVAVASVVVAGVSWFLTGSARDEVNDGRMKRESQPSPRPPSPVFSTAAGEKAGEIDSKRVTPGFIRIPAGVFRMGSPNLEPGRSRDELRHDVRISYDFEIQATEVTQAEYTALLGNNPSYSPECGADCPVEQVSWFEAAHYCNELSRRRGFSLCVVITEQHVESKGLQCNGFRLPTEAEWEYAARGGSAEAYYGEVDEVAWIDTNSSMKTHRVALKKPNDYGLFDMLGSVFEWTWDWMGDYRKEMVVDPTGPKAGDNRVFRGGAYRWTKDEARHAFRNAYGPLNKVEFIGFRCARSLL